MRSGRQRAILSFLAKWQAEHPYPPTIRELMLGTATSSQSVVIYNLRQLREAGLVSFLDNEARTVVLAGTTYIWPTVEDVAS